MFLNLIVKFTFVYKTMFVLSVWQICCSVICSLDNLLATINVYFFLF